MRIAAFISDQMLNIHAYPGKFLFWVLDLKSSDTEHKNRVPLFQLTLYALSLSGPQLWPKPEMT